MSCDYHVTILAEGAQEVMDVIVKQAELSSEFKVHFLTSHVIDDLTPCCFRLKMVRVWTSLPLVTNKPSNSARSV